MLWPTLLLGFTLCGSAQPDPGSCSRRLSRDVRAVLANQVFAPLSLNQSSLPPDCLLRLDADLFVEHEMHKTVASRSGYHKCMYCNKTFRSEEYLDRHMDNRHMDHISPDNHYCLADLAPLLGLRPREDAKKRSSSAFSPSRLASKCSPSILEKLSYRCTAIARSCFDDDPISDDMTAFIDLVCSELACRHGQLVGLAGDPSDDEDEYSVFGVIWTIVKVLIAGSIVVGLSLYVWSSYPSWFQRRSYNSRHREQSMLHRKLFGFFKFNKEK